MPTKPSASEALAKTRALCAKQERCRSEVLAKLRAWGADEGEAEKIITRLIKENFLNEARFAEHYAVSKFRQKGWGRVKIKYALKEKQVGSADIEKGMREIDKREYLSTLRSLVKKAWAKGRGQERNEREQRVIRYMIGRGFEVDLVKDVLQG